MYKTTKCHTLAETSSNRADRVSIRLDFRVYGLSRVKYLFYGETVGQDGCNSSKGGGAECEKAGV